MTLIKNFQVSRPTVKSIKTFLSNFLAHVRSQQGNLCLRTLTKKILFELNDKNVNTVSLTGNFTDWDTKGIPLKKNWRGIWRIQIKLNPGKYEYKFIINKNDWITDPTNPETVINSFGTRNSIRIVT
ncbi:MAG: glycogen-binding domain-containing protein [Candidatus Omnitrophica bacterium]|nr:glycogen-binding domain-containing protein [Candidatus Omnitrophota bacterium]